MQRRRKRSSASPETSGSAAGAAGRAVSERYSWDAVNGALVDGYLRIIRHRELGGHPINRPR